MRQDPDGEFVYSDDPNALERIAMGFDESVNLGGGSHGSLHANDSVVPLILAGAPGGFRLPPDPRTVDVALLCLSLLGMESGRALAQSHVRRKYRQAADHVAEAT